MSMFFLGAILSFLAFGEAVKFEILKPNRTTGDEVALIFTSGNSIKGEQYRKTGEFIRAEQKDCIIKTNNISGQFLYSAAEKFSLKAVVLMGFCLPLNTKPQDYSVPVLTLAAELDGVTRITRVAEELGKLQQEMRDDQVTLYKAPIVFLEGMNHAQFASGAMPNRVINNDLESEVTEEDAHRMIGKYVDTFLTATFSSETAKVDSALLELEQAYSEAAEKLQPFLDVKALDVSGNFSQWTIMAQQHVAGEFVDQIRVNNKMWDDSWFFFNKPSITKNGDLTEVNTMSLVHYSLSSPEYLMMVNMPREVNMKLMPKDAIWAALTDGNNASDTQGPQSSLRSEPSTCKSLNELALEIALNHSTTEAQNRYRKKGRPIVFEEDDIKLTDIAWSLKSLDYWENKSGFHVRAIAYHPASRGTRNPGMLYCKVLSPYRAMEWVNLLSLKEAVRFG
ncbi:titin [Elysia marginata]|uniref:Titin n=1 Tax=Elysia marginata TaxID=1093978 RepID=A0AAV4I7X0_9GAST|nr:titin [Elysia marginata]